MSAVDHPAHYNSRSVECIEVVEHLPFCTGNAIKYLWRAGAKGDRVEDLQKALWYARRAVIRIDSPRAYERQAAAGAFMQVAAEFDVRTRVAISALITGLPGDAIENIEQLIREAHSRA